MRNGYDTFFFCGSTNFFLDVLFDDSTFSSWVEGRFLRGPYQAVFFFMDLNGFFFARHISIHLFLHGSETDGFPRGSRKALLSSSMDGLTSSGVVGL